MVKEQETLSTFSRVKGIPNKETLDVRTLTVTSTVSVEDMLRLDNYVSYNQSAHNS